MHDFHDNYIQEKIVIKWNYCLSRLAVWLYEIEFNDKYEEFFKDKPKFDVENSKFYHQANRKEK